MELSPFLDVTGPALFNWTRDGALLSGEAEARVRPLDRPVDQSVDPSVDHSVDSRSCSVEVSPPDTRLSLSPLTRVSVL